MDFEKLAREFLTEQKLLKRAHKPPEKDKCGFGWASGEWEESMEDYRHAIKYNYALISATKNFLIKVVEKSNVNNS
jgi:hypothetical protein